MINLQNGTHTLSNNNIDSAAKEYPMGSHNPLFHNWNSPWKARIQEN